MLSLEQTIFNWLYIQFDPIRNMRFTSNVMLQTVKNFKNNKKNKRRVKFWWLIFFTANFKVCACVCVCLIHQVLGFVKQILKKNKINILYDFIILNLSRVNGMCFIEHHFGHVYIDLSASLIEIHMHTVYRQLAMQENFN